MSANLYIGDRYVACPTEVTVNSEIIWSSDTGRTMSAYMMGEVVGRKETASIKWEFLTQEQVEKLEAAVDGSAFGNASFEIDGTVIFSMNAYRSTLAKSLLGKRGGTVYYRSVTVDLIER